MKGILGRKIGMTEVFTEDGFVIPVTVIQAEPNTVTQIKTVATDGYDAIQLGFETVKEKSVNKPKLGHTNKAKSAPKRFLKEIRGVDVSSYNLGDEVNVDIFERGEYVDISGISKGKGFAGAIKRHGYARGPMAHGSQYHRGVGSLGTLRAKRVFKGTEMPGHLGVAKKTIQNLLVVEVDPEKNIILVKGNVPGPKKGLIVIEASLKKRDKKKELAPLVDYSKEKTEDKE